MNFLYVSTLLRADAVHELDEATKVAAVDVDVERVGIVEQRQGFISDLAADLGNRRLGGEDPVFVAAYTW